MVVTHPLPAICPVSPPLHDRLFFSLSEAESNEGPEGERESRVLKEARTGEGGAYISESWASSVWEASADRSWRTFSDWDSVVWSVVCRATRREVDVEGEDGLGRMNLSM